MDALVTALALALPVLLGGLWLGTLLPGGMPARGAIVWGNGTLLGLMVLTLIMRLLHAAGIPLAFAPAAIACAALAALAALAVLLRAGRGRPAALATGSAAAALSRPGRLLCTLLLALIALRLLTLGLEVLFRPLFPWDATMHWATKARVWFEYRSMVPFVGPGVWLETGGEGVFTDRHPGYPPMIPLLQVWMNLATGRWDESLMNLPWVLCLAGLGGAFYGQLRLAGSGVTTATAFTYLLLSMPLINTHVALAGYADLFLGAAYCCALMALHNWVQFRDGRLAALAVAFALLCPMIKNEGLVWSLTLVPAFSAALLQRREAAKLLLLLALTAAFIALVLPEDVKVAGHTLTDLQPTFNLEALDGLVKSIWQHDSWHLFGYMLLVLLPIGALTPGIMSRKYLSISLALGCALGSFIFLFLFTRYSWGASNFAAVGRLSIQLAPGLLFLCALVFNELEAPGTDGAAPGRALKTP